jgi:hypothetical protein
MGISRLKQTFSPQSPYARSSNPVRYIKDEVVIIINGNKCKIQPILPCPFTNAGKFIGFQRISECEALYTPLPHCGVEG